MRTLFILVALAGCDSASIQPCTSIPEGGCPLAYGQACKDPACAAVYACLPGNRWELRGTCTHDASSPSDAGTTDVATEDVKFDGAFGGPGCADLQPPDCPLGVALVCPSGCCGCEDLFVCVGGGWSFWGTCGPDGAVPE